MPSVNVYLTFNGNCEEAFEFYRSVFGGEFSYVGRFKDMPSSPENDAFKEQASNKIMHISLPISKETMIMGSDTGGEWAAGFTQGNNFSISINADSKEEADRIFNSLSTDGKVTMPLADTFWGDYFGMFTDRYGINWMMSYNQNQSK